MALRAHLSRAVHFLYAVYLPRMPACDRPLAASPPRPLAAPLRPLRLESRSRHVCDIMLAADPVRFRDPVPVSVPRPLPALPTGGVSTRLRPPTEVPMPSIAHADSMDDDRRCPGVRRSRSCADRVHAGAGCPQRRTTARAGPLRRAARRSPGPPSPGSHRRPPRHRAHCWRPPACVPGPRPGRDGTLASMRRQRRSTAGDPRCTVCAQRDQVRAELRLAQRESFRELASPDCQPLLSANAGKHCLPTYQEALKAGPADGARRSRAAPGREARATGLKHEYR